MVCIQLYCLLLRAQIQQMHLLTQSVHSTYVQHQSGLRQYCPRDLAIFKFLTPRQELYLLCC